MEKNQKLVRRQIIRVGDHNIFVYLYFHDTVFDRFFVLIKSRKAFTDNFPQDIVVAFNDATAAEGLVDKMEIDPDIIKTILLKKPQEYSYSADMITRYRISAGFCKLYQINLN